MADFNIRSDSVDVEQIMKQIRARIQEKRGVDYTEEQVRELASVRLEKFLDPKNLRSDLMDQFRRSRPPLPEVPADDVEPEIEPFQEPPPIEPPYAFDDQTLIRSHRSALRFIRRLLSPIFKLFWNPNTLNQILYAQSQFNIDQMKRDQRRRIEFASSMASFKRELQHQFRHASRQSAILERSRAEWNVLYYEVLHNLVLETTRNAIEVKNLRMRVEALASRLEFSERRVRALEGVVQYRPEVVRHGRRLGEAGGPTSSREDWSQGHDAGDEPLPTASNDSGSAAVARVTPSEGRRRRRRRRGRRPLSSAPGTAVGEDQQPSGEGPIEMEPANDADGSEVDEETGPDTDGDPEPQ